MANKFLGLDSVNVIIEYINEKLEFVNSNSRVLTLQAYKYSVDRPTTPVGGSFNSTNGVITYPDNWSSLYNVLKDYDDNEKLKDALNVGSIWMSSGVLLGNQSVTWSTPMKISGQNGLDGIDFRFSYNQVCPQNDRKKVAPVLSEEDGKDIVYYWVKPVEGEWPADDEPGMIWMKYTTDGKSGQDIKHQYTLTTIEDIDENENPIPPKSNAMWVNDILTIGISKERPYLWLRTQIVTAGENAKDNEWSSPVLFSSLGKDGNVPDYTITLYHRGYDDPEISDIHGIIAPQKPKFIDLTENPNATINDYITDEWVELPETDVIIQVEGEEPPVNPTPVVWWQCTIKVNGRNNTVETADSIGTVKRYSGVDGVAKAGQFTMNLYAWSANQEQPEMSETLIDGWRPENYNYLPDKPLDLNTIDASLWMITANVAGLDENGIPIVNGSWSKPVKLTGPFGRLSDNYRLEMRYMNGKAEAPRRSSEEIQWEEDPKNTNIALTAEYPYLWAKPYLVSYKMKYADAPNEDGSYDIEQVNEKPDNIIKEFSEYRLSGLNGEDGSIKNKLKYTTSAEEITIDNFSVNNLFISNSSVDVKYIINYNQIDFISGYTGKFSNVGSGIVTIETSDPYIFVNGTNNVTSFTLNSQETVELVCYKSGDLKQFIVIGKTL